MMIIQEIYVMKDFNALINNKPFFDKPAKKKKKKKRMKNLLKFQEIMIIRQDY